MHPCNFEFGIDFSLQTQLDLVACRFAEGIIEEGGLELLLSLPRPMGIRTSLAIVFACMVLIPSALQKIAALPRQTVVRFVESAMDPLLGTEDPAKKSAAVFLVNTLAQPVILGVFEELGGLKRVMTALSNSLLLLRRADSGQAARQERQVGSFHTLQTSGFS